MIKLHFNDCEKRNVIKNKIESQNIFIQYNEWWTPIIYDLLIYGNYVIDLITLEEIDYF